jgi:hypothetical protein
MLAMEAIRSSETSVHIRTTKRYIPEDGKNEGKVARKKMGK